MPSPSFCPFSLQRSAFFRSLLLFVLALGLLTFSAVQAQAKEQEPARAVEATGAASAKATGAASAKATGAASVDPVALVLFTFGTTYEQESDPLAPMRAEVAKRHPGLEIRTAYSSTHVLKTLRARGVKAGTLAQTLADLSSEGYTRVAVQSMHVIPGLEYRIAGDIAARFRDLPKGVEKVSLGTPLIASHENAALVAERLIASLPKERNKNDAVVFIGHGAAEVKEGEPGGLAYPALQALVAEIDPKVFIGTIEGPYDAEAMLAKLRAVKARKVWLVPMLTVIGDHAQNDIFGDEDDSWKHIFTKAGLETASVKRGLTADPGLIALWADHADEALAELE